MLLCSLPPLPASSPGQEKIADQSAQTTAAPVPPVAQAPGRAETYPSTIRSPTASDAQVRIDVESAGAVPPAAQAALSRALAAQGFAPPNWAVGKGPRDRVTVQTLFSGSMPVQGGENQKSAPFASWGRTLLWQFCPSATRQKITGPGSVDIWLPDPAIKPLLVNKTSQSKKVTPTPLPLPRK